MAQVFSARTVLAMKLAALGALALGGAAGVVAYQHLDGPYSLGEAPPQPVPFSHRHHVGDDGIDCRYCHATVETTAFAGMPSTHTCMTCHSQLFTDQAVLAPVRDSAASGVPLRWTRVHDLPDFAYFDHSIHVRKGVGCIECHGRVDLMPSTRRVAPLEMQWCLECHRDPEPRRRAAAWVTEMRPTAQVRAEGGLPDTAIAGTRRLTDCSTCHR